MMPAESSAQESTLQLRVAEIHWRVSPLMAPARAAQAGMTYMA